MTKKAYIGASGVARSIKKIYIGVGGVAKKVKKAYIGVGGIARLFFGNLQPKYKGEITSLGQTKQAVAAGVTGSYAVFAGGTHGHNITTTATAESYSKTLTRTSITSLPIATEKLSGCQVGSYALFAGGRSNGLDSKKTVYSYSDALTLGRAEDLGYAHNYFPPCSNTDTFAAFAGGSNWGDCSACVTFYNKALVKSLGSLNAAKASAAGNHVGQYVIFAGGEYTQDGASPTQLCTVEAFNAAVTHYDLFNLSYYRTTPVAVGSYAMFLRSGAYPAEVYNSSLTKLTTGVAKSPVTERAVTLGGFALVVGDTKSNLVYSYDESLTLQQRESFTPARLPAGMAAVGDYAIFAGGLFYDQYDGTGKVEVYELA